MKRLGELSQIMAVFLTLFDVVLEMVVTAP
jgi:hypothetical protein